METPYDFPSFLAEFIKNEYKEKRKSSQDLLHLFLNAILNPQKWVEPWKKYPIWRANQLKAEAAKKQKQLTTTPPQNYCPHCGTDAKLDSVHRCPQCGGFYHYDGDWKFEQRIDPAKLKELVASLAKRKKFESYSKAC